MALTIAGLTSGQQRMLLSDGWELWRIDEALDSGEWTEAMLLELLAELRTKATVEGIPDIVLGPEPAAAQQGLLGEFWQSDPGQTVGEMVDWAADQKDAATEAVERLGTFWKSWGTWIVAGGVVLVGLVVAARAARAVRG